jgi:hypothetical protein
LVETPAHRHVRALSASSSYGPPLLGPPLPLGSAVVVARLVRVTAFQDGPVLLWDVDPTSWPSRACALAGRRLTKQEWNDFLPGRPYKPSCGPP